MRIALLSFYTIMSSGVSEIKVFEPYLERLDEIGKQLGEPLYVYVLAPVQMMKTFPIKHDRVKVIWHSMTGRNFHIQIGATPARFVELFNETSGLYQIDAVWTAKSVGAMMMPWDLRDYRSKKPAIPVFVDEGKAEDFTESQHKQTLTEQELLYRAVSYTLGHGIFHTPHERDVAVRASSRYLSPAMAETMRKGSLLIPHNVPVSKVRKHRAANKKNKQFTLFFGGRFNDAKNPDALAKIFDEFFAFGRDVRIVMTCPSQNKTTDKLEKKYTNVQIIKNCSQERYFDEMTKSHVILSLSKNEGFSNSTMQAMVSGSVVILPHDAWVLGLLEGPRKGPIPAPLPLYPFLYDRGNGGIEAASLLRWVYEHYEEAEKQMAPYSDWVEQTYGVEHVDWGLERMKQFNEISEGLTDKALSKYWNSVASNQLMEKALSDLTLRDPSQPFSMGAFFETVKRNARAYSNSERIRGQWSQFVMYEWLRKKKDYVDLCDGPEPRFLSRKEWKKREGSN